MFGGFGYMEREYDQLVKILADELKPALGVTEVGAIALAAAKAYGLVGGEPLKVHIFENGGMYKNAHACFIPGTGKLGSAMAALLGVVAGNSDLGLEALRNVTDKHVRIAELMAEREMVTITPLDTEPDIYIRAEVETSLGQGVAVIKKRHTNFTYLEKNGEVLFDAGDEAENPDGDRSIGDFSIGELFEFCRAVRLEDIAFVYGLVEMNRSLSREGSEGAGLKIAQSLDEFGGRGLVGDDVIYYAQRLTCDALDARLAGLPHPAMSIAGSGSHGVLCSLPVSAFAEKLCSGREAEIRAVALSALITLYIKHFCGRLSSLCGCVMAGASGAAAGIAMLLGADAAQTCDAVNNMAANLTGMICDGGSIGCSLKASAGIYSAALSAFLAIRGTSIPSGFGVVGATAEETVRNVGAISMDGMSGVDKTIIGIMQNSLN